MLHVSVVWEETVVGLDWWQNLKRGLEITLGVIEC